MREELNTRDVHITIPCPKGESKPRSLPSHATHERFVTLSGYASPTREHPIEAGASFLQARDLTCRQRAKSLELRAVTSLSRLWQQQGKYAKACKLLAEVYGWCTEGCDPADLHEARALLQELGSQEPSP